MKVSRIEVDEVVIEEIEGLSPWYLSWSGVWVGALSAVALLLVFGLTGIAVGAHQLGRRIGSWHEFHLVTLAFSVFGSFLSFVLGGWVAARIAGIRRAEPAMLHGAIVWLVAIPGLLFLAALGAGGYFGTWYTGLAAPPAWAPQATPIESPGAALTYQPTISMRMVQAFAASRRTCPFQGSHVSTMSARALEPQRAGRR